MKEINSNAQVVKNSNESANAEKEWSNKTFTQETIARILAKAFDWETKINKISDDKFIMDLEYSSLTIIRDCGKWVVSDISFPYIISTAEMDEPVAPKAAKELADVANVLDNASWILSEYKMAESTGGIASMLKYNKTLLEWGLTQDEINSFNWFYNSYMITERL